MGVTADNSKPADPIHVICVADAGYGAYAGIMLSSVLNSNSHSVIHCHLLDDGVHVRDLRLMAQMVRRKGGALSVYNIKERLDAQPNIQEAAGYYSRAIFGKLFIAEFLPESISRVIYLDCDVICTSSLRELWDLGVTIPILGAVRDKWVDQDVAHKRSIGMPANAPYYNSGVLIINLGEWRTRNIPANMSKYLRSIPTPRYGDQDAINSVLWGEITELTEKWNVLTSCSEPERTLEDLNGAVNIHYCGGVKPWQLGYARLQGSASARFQRAKALSPWKWKMPDFHFGRIRRKLTKLARRLTMRRISNREAKTSNGPAETI